MVFEAPNPPPPKVLVAGLAPNIPPPEDALLVLPKRPPPDELLLLPNDEPPPNVVLLLPNMAFKTGAMRSWCDVESVSAFFFLPINH